MGEDEMRQPPHDLDAERAVLGAMMLSRDALLEVSDIVSAGSFYRPIHGMIFDAIVGLAAKGEPADPLTVTAALAEAGTLVKVGGAPYLHSLTQAPETAANGRHYARIVADRADSRELGVIGARIAAMAASGQDPAGARARAQEMLADFEAASAPAAGGPRMWSQVIPEVLDEIDQAGQTAEDETPGVSTGLKDLDRVLGGLLPGQLIVVGARPGVGKSVLLANIAQHAAWRLKLPAVLFSLEMSRTELGKRMLSADTRVPLNSLRSGKLTDDEWTKVARSAGESESSPLAIDDTPDLTVSDIRARARKLHRQVGGLSLIAVDYLQLITPHRGENRQLAVTEISRGLKLLAKQLEVPVIVAAQLNRGPEQRSDKRPQSSDFRESGSIENDADTVILIHREDHYDKESPRSGEADLIVDKNRGGERDTVVVASQLHLARFKSIAQ